MRLIRVPLFDTPMTANSRFRVSGLWWKLPLILVPAWLVAMPFAIRGYRLAGLPSAPEPFDLAAARHVEIASVDNAFELYRTAAGNLVPISAAARGQPDALDGTWRDVPSEWREWLTQNRAALEPYLAGTALPESLYHQPGEMQINTTLDIVQKLRELARLSELEAMRLEDAGDPEGAWKWNLAIFRCSRHCGMHGCLIEHLVGNALHGRATESVTRWAADPHVTAAMLRTALADVQASYRMTAPLSTPLKVEYLMLAKTISDSDGRSQLISSGDAPEIARLGPLLYPLGEPEMSLRVARLLWANILSQCDRPRPLRAALVAGKSGVYEEDAASKIGSSDASLSPEKIEEWMQRTLLLRLMAPAMNQAVLAHDREQARQALLEVLLAAQLYYREKGEFPESAELLVGDFLDALPIDPFGTGDPVHYRREPDRAAGATIWSIGPDGHDDDGKLDMLQPPQQTQQKGDLILRSQPPAADKGITE